MVAVLFASASPAVAAAVADPDYQVKLLLSSDAIDSDGAPSAQFRSYFPVLGEVGSETSVYFDTEDGFYANNGWSIRLRHKDGAGQYDLTYKYRQPLFYNSLSKDVIDVGVKQARANNFDSSDTNYRAQVNASYFTSTLDFSNRKAAACVTAQCQIPASKEAIAIVAGAEPGKLTKVTGTSLGHTDLRMSQTVEQKAWRVEVGGIKTDLEVSTFSGQRWVEISEEETSRKNAVRKRDELIAALKQSGLLLEQDAFKTSAVLASGWQ